MAKQTTQTTTTQDDTIYIGCDDGFAATDIVVIHGNSVITELCIPSRARAGVHGTTVIGTGGDKGLVPCYESEGVQFTVESDLADAESARFADYPFSAMNRVIVSHALRLAGMGGKDVRIATGLPLSMFYKGDKPNAEVISRKDASLRTAVRALDGSPTANIIQHAVYPEGLAAWIDHALDANLNMRIEGDETYGVIDVGGRTTDCAVVMPGQRVDHARCGSAEVGVLNVVEHLRVSLLKKLGFEFTGSQIENALRTGSVKVFGKQQSIEDEIAEAVAQVEDSIQREVNRRFGSAHDIDHMLLVGGGAHIFKGILQRYPNVTIPEKPEFANARGFAKFLKMSSATN